MIKAANSTYGRRTAAAAIQTTRTSSKAARGDGAGDAVADGAGADVVTGAGGVDPADARRSRTVALPGCEYVSNRLPYRESAYVTKW